MPALVRRPAGLLGGSVQLLNSIVRVRDQYFALPTLKFEAVTLGLAVLFGLLIMPALIYLAGSFTLQEYGRGGLLDLYREVFKGLFQLRASYWIVIIGPFVFLSVFRVFRWLLRKL
jgi:hypothetical protein